MIYIRETLLYLFFTQRDNTYVWQQRYEKDKIDNITYIGGSGRDKNLEAWSPHLHLSYYKYEASLTDIDIDGDTISIVNIKNLKDYLRNPFNHKSESWKGSEY